MIQIFEITIIIIINYDWIYADTVQKQNMKTSKFTEIEKSTTKNNEQCESNVDWDFFSIASVAVHHEFAPE